MVYLFCRVSRHKLIYDELLLKAHTDADLTVPAEGIVMEHIKNGSKLRLTRKLIGQLCITTMVKKNTKQKSLSARPTASAAASLSRCSFSACVQADFAEQLFSWQDLLFDNETADGGGKLHYSGNNFGCLWPGPNHPARCALLLP